MPSSPAYAPVYDPREGIPRNPEFPFLVWEGDLVQGLNGVVIIPTIWEIDGGGSIFPHFQTALDEAAPEILATAATLAGGPATGQAVRPAAQATFRAIERATSDIRRETGDRLIGIGQTPFRPWLIQLNYDIAEEVMRTRIGRAPAGILSIPYHDEGDLNGDYTLYLKVERIDRDTSTPP